MIKVGRFTERDKCPACSSEVDKGGRLVASKKKHWYLKCLRCKYSITEAKVTDRNAKFLKKRRDKKLFGKQWRNV